MSRPCRVFADGMCEITQEFSSSHGGMDLTAQDYTFGWIVAHTDGIVVDRREDCTGFEPNGSYGNFVKIKHSDGYYTLYAHIQYDTVQVNVGDNVKKGQNLGYMGATGTAYGAHLHFEVRNPDDVRINPDEFLDNDLPNMIPITPNVERDENKYQVYVSATELNVRTTPSLSGEILGYASVGYYNVLDEVEADNYTWLKIADNNYIAYNTDWETLYPIEDYKKLYEESLIKIAELNNKIIELNNKIIKAIEDLS